MFNPLIGSIFKDFRRIYQRDEHDEGDGPLILELSELLSHENLDGVRQVVHRLLGRIQVQDLDDAHIVWFLCSDHSPPGAPIPMEKSWRKSRQKVTIKLIKIFIIAFAIIDVAFQMNPCQIAEVVHRGEGGVVGLWDPRVRALVGHDELRKSECVRDIWTIFCGSNSFKTKEYKITTHSTDAKDFRL